MTRPTHFFYKNRLAIFNQKVYNMTKKLEDFEKNYLPYIGKYSNEGERTNFINCYNHFSQLSREEIAEKIVAYAGLNENTVSEFLKPSEMWFRRFDHYCYVANGERVVIDNVDDLEGIFENSEFIEVANPKSEVVWINRFYFWMMILKARIDSVPDKIREQNERLAAYVRDSFTSCEDY